MKAYIITGREFSGELEVVYKDNILYQITNNTSIPSKFISLLISLIETEDKGMETVLYKGTMCVYNKKIEVSFEQFYNEYGVKLGRKAAEKAWQKLSNTQRIEAFLYIKKYKAKKQLSGQFLAHPATYLNQELWTD